MDRKNWRPAVPSLIVAFLLALCPVAQSQDLAWAKRAGGAGSAQGRAIAVDDQGGNQHGCSSRAPWHFAGPEIRR
jgi:hypothetical protein